MKPTISVITPIYNGSEHILECVKSVTASQTNGTFDIEHIIVDDGSTDNCMGKIPYNCRKNLKYIGLDKNCGKPATVRNVGIENASGDYIFCLDHDDVLIQTGLLYLFDYLQSNGLSVVYGDFLRANTGLSYTIGNDYWGWDHENTKDLLYSIFIGEHYYQHSLMFTRDLFDSVGGYNPEIKFGEDLDLCVRFIFEGQKPQHVRSITHVHRNHRSNMTKCYDNDKDKGVWFAEKRLHYNNHRETLTSHLDSAQIEKIETLLFSKTKNHGLIV